MKLFIQTFKSKNGNDIYVLKLVTIINEATYETKTQSLFLTKEQYDNILKNGVQVVKC